LVGGVKGVDGRGVLEGTAVDLGVAVGTVLNGTTPLDDS
jgi:hypothetical protein